MTLRELMSLGHGERLSAAGDAVYIGKREEGKFFLELYQLDGFYIEVYHFKKYNHIVGIYGFDDMAKLDPYLEKITLPLSF